MKKIILIAVLLAGIVAFIVLTRTSSEINSDEADVVGEITTDPLDTVSPFYNDWLKALLSTSTNPYDLGLDNDERLTDEVKNYIQIERTNSDSVMDPVICQFNYPPRIGAKLSYNQDGKAQFLLLARGMGITPERAVVDLEHRNGSWKISKIECVSGESAPEREFTFEKQGFLLKNDQPPLNPDTWYVVYEENGIDGHFAPLTFADDSMCYDKDSNESVCDANSFRNATQAIVKGEMSEVGVNVKRIEFLEN